MRKNVLHSVQPAAPAVPSPDETVPGAAGERRVWVQGDRVLVPREEGWKPFPLMPLPEKFVDWIEQGRRSMYGKLVGKSKPGFFTSHLPVMTTFSGEKDFPFNCSNKGVGFLPKAEYLEHFKDLFRKTIERTRGRPWQESMKERIEAVSSFYLDREKIDLRALSTLEIFERGTYRNLSKLPMASLLYTGNGPDYTSFQVNCAVEVIKPDDPRHEFVKLARVMFEYDSFHISQTNFPYAYVLWISEVLDKTPFRVPEKGNVVAIQRKGDLTWDPAAIESVNRAPGMIRQFITESIEKYARDRGFKHISMEILREAREVLERPDSGEEPASITAGNSESTSAEKETKTRGVRAPYRKIYVGLDSSPLSDAAMELALSIGTKNQAEMVGSHVYAAKMHDNRFRAMEGGLPEEFQKEKELNRQRKIHDSLITKGLELITDSYLEGMKKSCDRENLKFTGVSLEGKNWKALAEDIEGNDYDLIALGAHGIGQVGNSQLGTVADRVIRRVKRDVLLCKVPESENASDEILVCLDGSARSWGALQRAFQLAGAFGKRVTAVSAFDPYFHYAMFKSLNRALTDKARKVFKFEEQEKLHEDIIDSGLAKIYQSYLNIAKRMAEEEGRELSIHLLDGKPFEKILQRARKSPPWLLVVGRIGFHSEEDMDIGGNTENLCRLAPCNILIVDGKDKPTSEMQADETVSWTTEARARMKVIPVMAQGMAMKAIQNYCVAEGFTVVTESVLDAAVRTILPPEALARMGIPATADAPRKDEAPSLEQAQTHDHIAMSYKCQACGHVHHGSRPKACPICGMGGHIFKILESAVVEDGQVLSALGERQLLWEKSALETLNAIGNLVLREQTRNRLEKGALTQRLHAITDAMVREAAGIEQAEAESGKTNAPVEATPGALLWSEAAAKRLERVPEGFMRKAALGMVEQYARSQGAGEITLEIAEAGLGKAREKMHASLKKEEAPSPEAVSPPSQPSSDPLDAEPACWECHLCGMWTEGGRPSQCSNCGTGHFTAVSAADYAERPPLSFRALTWDEEARERLRRVPEGFMRDMTRCRVEKWARAAGQGHVTIEIMDGKYGSWSQGAASMRPELEWSDEARLRAERIPEFIRPMVMKEIERRVKLGGRDTVAGTDLDAAMQHWSSSGDFHGKR